MQIIIRSAYIIIFIVHTVCDYLEYEQCQNTNKIIYFFILYVFLMQQILLATIYSWVEVKSSIYQETMTTLKVLTYSYCVVSERYDSY